MSAGADTRSVLHRRRTRLQTQTVRTTLFIRRTVNCKQPVYVVCFWTPRVSPRRNRKFHRGEANIWDILGGWSYATDKRTNRQKVGQHHCVKPRLCGCGGLATIRLNNHRRLTGSTTDDQRRRRASLNLELSLLYRAICPSVCLSHAGIVAIRAYILTFFYRFVVLSL